jgi:Bacterial Ig-like domain
MKTFSKFAPLFQPILPALLAAMFMILVSACMQEPAGIVIPCNQPKGLITSPANGDTGVPLDPILTVKFDTTKDTASFDSTSIILVHGTDTIGGTTFYQPSDTTLFFIPNDSLQPHTSYIITVNVPTDSIVPGPGGPLGPGGPGVPLDTTVTVTFTTQDTTPQDTVPVPDAPVLFQQGAGDYSRSLITPPFNLDWFPSSGAVTYRMQISTSPLFTTTVFDLSGIPPHSPLVFQAVPLSDLPVGTYYRRVDATNSGGTSAWSTVLSFTMGP